MSSPKNKTVGVQKARTHLSALLKQVERGHEIVITNRERPIARLVPVRPVGTNDREIWAKILAFRGRIVLPKGETGKDLIEAGRRM